MWRVRTVAALVVGIAAQVGLVACGSSSPHASTSAPHATTTVTVTTASTNATPITIPCVDDTTGHTDFLSAPVNCHIQPGREGLGMASLLKDLTWRSWGQHEARATGSAGCGGTGCATRPPVPAQVVVYGMVGDHYTRARVTQSGFSRVQRLDELPYEPPPESTQTSPAPAQPERPACAGGKYNSQGSCLSDPTFRALCDRLYREWREGGPGSEAAIQEFGKLLCDQSPY